MNSAVAERINRDIVKVRDLAAASDGRIKIVSVTGNPPHTVVLELGYRTAKSSNYPREHATKAVVEIKLADTYPFREPSVTFKSEVFHPNVYRGGRVCLGTKWVSTEGLDLLVKRLIRIMTFDPDVSNPGSPANGDAASWYRNAVRSFPGAFPTEQVYFAAQKKPAIVWSTIKS
ncbi:MAG: hypothetical protein LBR29_01450 [Methylobacteriaceae bacterium]|jgi:ubiquitin-protein ligase|nr:hypothetical protein [Methylobacteriaceae bacterium]